MGIWKQYVDPLPEIVIADFTFTEEGRKIIDDLFAEIFETPALKRAMALAMKADEFRKTQEETR